MGALTKTNAAAINTRRYFMKGVVPRPGPCCMGPQGERLAGQSQMGLKFRVLLPARVKIPRKALVSVSSSGSL